MHGWAGKILFVDLEKRQVSKADTAPYVEPYVGGRGMGARLYWELVAPSVRPFDPENHLIFTVGPLVGARAQAATVMSVVGKSPGALPESYCYGNIAGYVGPELKKAGYDGVVVTGRAGSPVYLWIDDERVEIRDAGELWGRNAFAAAATLKSEHGPKIKFIVIGVSGENLVRTATAYASHESALSCGFGAVMGSKNLKGMAIRGTGSVTAADPEKLKELNRYTVAINKRLHLAIGPDVLATGHGSELEVVGRGELPSLRLRVHSQPLPLRQAVGGAEALPDHGVLSPLGVWAPRRTGRYLLRCARPRQRLLHRHIRVAEHDQLAVRLPERRRSERGGHRAAVGQDRDAGVPGEAASRGGPSGGLRRSACRRDGPGRLDGRAARRTRALMGREVAPIGQFELQPPRLNIVHSLLYFMEPRVHQPLLHDTGFALVPWSAQSEASGSHTNNQRSVPQDSGSLLGERRGGRVSTPTRVKPWLPSSSRIE